MTGLATDALNRIVVASTLDGTINVRVSINEVHRDDSNLAPRIVVLRLPHNKARAYPSVTDGYCGDYIAKK